MKRLLSSLFFLLMVAISAMGQDRTVTGTVTATEDGLPLPGVSVKVPGGTVATQTNANGRFSLSVPASARSLDISYVGYSSQTLTIGANNVVNASLVVDTKQLGEVVVTGALGVKRASKELGYASTNIDSKKITETHPTNFTNGLTAKAPGLVISTFDNGINPGTRFTLRGNRHINGNNYALVLLNGVPISPNDVNTINPEDIESVDILNGAGAASLYGSEASNGALSITTKRGASGGEPLISYSNSFLAETISYFPSLQTRFGGYGGEGGIYVDPLTGFIIKQVPYENQSYGPEYDGSLQQLGLPTVSGAKQLYPYSTPGTDPRLAFFNTGYSDQNNISYAAGDSKNSFNLSANNLTRTGVVPDDKYDRTVVRLSAGKTYGIFKADFTGSYARQKVSTYGFGYDGNSSMLATLLNTPSWVPINSFQDLDAEFSDQNSYFNSYGVNPYWIVKKSRFNTQSDDFNGSFSGTLTPSKWFDATYRIANNFGVSQQQYTRAQVDFSAYAHSDPDGTGNRAQSALGGAANTPGSLPGQVNNVTQYGDGSLSTGAGPQGYSRVSQDVFVNFHKTFFDDFKANLLLGNSLWQQSYQRISNLSNQLLVKDFYNIGSILGVPTTAQSTAKIRQIAFFAALNLGYKDYAFLEVSDRNDRDSRLAASNRSFFYPSAKASFVFTQAIPMLQDNKILSYGKLRGSYSRVGDVNVAPYSINNTFNPTNGFPYGSIGGLSLSTTLNNPQLKPELTKEIEFGADLGFLDNRINTNATYYKSNTTDQTLAITTSPSTGYLNTLVNVGEVENTGYEFKLDIQALNKATNKVGLNLTGNFSIQNSKVVSLVSGLNQITLGSPDARTSIAAVVGQPYPVLFATDVNRDPDGKVIVSSTTGNPSTNPNLLNMGQTTPKYILGLSQTVSYKILSLSATSEFRTGNVTYNQGLRQATAAGVSALSASSGRQRFVFPNSVIQTSPGVYVPNTNTTTSDGDISFFDGGAFYNAGSTYVTSAAFWKLREVNLNVDLTSFIKKQKFVKRASFALVGRNLLMYRPKSNTWIDPEFVSTSGNAVGFSTDQLPPTRLFGANLNVTF